MILNTNCYPLPPLYHNSFQNCLQKGQEIVFFCFVRIAAVLISTLMTATLGKVKIAVLKDGHFRAIFDYAHKLLRLYWGGCFFRKCCFSPTQ